MGKLKASSTHSPSPAESPAVRFPPLPTLTNLGLIGLLFGLAPDAIRRAAAAFTGVEHRLQSVALVDGVRFVNDSQGTQPDAVIAALRAFPAPVVLIAGGRDKGVDLAELARVVGQTAAAAVLIGESGPTLGTGSTSV